MPQRKTWNNQQDKVLKFLKEEQGQKKWSVIASRMQMEFGIGGRTGKQCRQRYQNHLDNSNLTTSWSKKEEESLLRMHGELGNKWSAIAQRLAGRSDNCVKNHFYAKLRKALRRLNKLIADHFSAIYQEIKLTAVSTILEVCSSGFKDSCEYEQAFIQRCQDLKKRLYSLDWCIKEAQSEQPDLEEAQRVIRKLNQFQSIQKRRGSRPQPQQIYSVDSQQPELSGPILKKEEQEEIVYWTLKTTTEDHFPR